MLRESACIPKLPALKQLVDHKKAGTVSHLPSRPKRQPKPNKKFTYDILGGLACVPAHMHQCIFAASKKKDPDTLSYDEAMADTENIDKWMQAMAKDGRINFKDSFNFSTFLSGTTASGRWKNFVDYPIIVRVRDLDL